MLCKKYESARDAVIVNLNVLKEMPVPGGEEERYLNDLTEKEIEEGGARRTGQAHRFVTSMNREDGAVRIEITQSAINFLDERMDIEEDGTINSLMINRYLTQIQQ